MYIVRRVAVTSLPGDGRVEPAQDVGISSPLRKTVPKTIATVGKKLSGSITNED